MDIIETKILITYLENILSKNDKWNKKLKSNIKSKYSKAPYFSRVPYYNTDHIPQRISVPSYDPYLKVGLEPQLYLKNGYRDVDINNKEIEIKNTGNNTINCTKIKNILTNYIKQMEEANKIGRKILSSS
jgi:hypothetical protein